MSTQIFIGENPIEKYVIVAENDGWRAKNTAVYLLNRYIEETCGVFLKREENDREYMIKIEEITEGVHDEYMRIRSEGNNVLISGGIRGVIYAVCEFLERYVGVRWYALDCEVLPVGKIVVPTDIDYEHVSSIVEYREVYGGVSDNSEFRMKRRLRDQGIDSAYGYSPDFIGTWHSLSGGELLNRAEYKEKHPEWFSLVNGKRLMGHDGQVCPTSGAENAVVDEVKARIRQNPRARYISVSIGDNRNYCRCENCMKELETQSLSDLHFTFINRIAKEVKKGFPNTLLHVFAYYWVEDPPTFELEDNIAVQYCSMNVCHSHAIDDPNCPHNVQQAEKVRAWSKKCKYLMVWDYNDNHAFNLIQQPSIVYYRQNVRFYVENNMQAFFDEDAHVRGDGCPTFSEMKCYLFSKLLWDPYMSEDEYKAHMLEFAEAYYGAGGKYIVEYLYLWAKEASVWHMRYMTMTFEKLTPIEPPVNASKEEEYNAIDANFINRSVPVIPMERLNEVLSKANELFDKAEALAGSKEQLERVKRSRVHILFYELFFTMDDILEKGTKEEIEEVKAKNAKLIHDIWKYRFKRTLYRGTFIEQASDLVGLYEVSPKKWGYGWWRDANK